MKIPRQLHDPDLRFFLVKPNSKFPSETKWNSTNTYPFFHSRLLSHIRLGGNYGVCTGVGGLIVLDIDCREFYYQAILSSKLPPTFTVLSARKRLPHLYYYLGDDMIRKRGVDINSRRVVDIQAARSGVVGPNSNLDMKAYQVIINREIAFVFVRDLESLFGPLLTPTTYETDTTEHPEAVQDAITLLCYYNIRRTGPVHFKCPFHHMGGTGNLAVMPSGRLYCFHEQRTWQSIYEFLEEYHAKGTDTNI